jgi:hypothetical protein
MADEVQPEAGQGQPVAPVVAAPAQVQNDGPWASDLALLGLDADTLGKVDTFLRAKVQPYTTKLEQDLASAKPAQVLYNDLTDAEKATDAYVAVTYEMFGQEAGDRLVAALQGSTPDAAAPAQPEAPQLSAAQYAQLSPEDRAFIDELKQLTAEQQYDKDMNAVIVANPDINPDHLHIWVAQANGDFDQAIQLYRNYTASFITAPQGEQAPAAVPVLGSDSGGAAASTTPVAPKKQTMAQAIDRTMAMLAHQEAPPVVG